MTLALGNHRERGKIICADFGKTRFGCRMFQLCPEGAIEA